MTILSVLLGSIAATMAPPQPSGSFTPAAGVTASQYSGISTGTLLTVNLPTGVGAKPVANAPFLYYPMETDLSTSPLSRQTVTATPSTDTANGGIRITSDIPTGLGQAGAAFLEPNSNGNKQPFTDGGFGNIVNTTGNWYVSIKKFESAWCQNNKRFRFWGSNDGNPSISKNDVYSNDTLSAVDINGGYIFNGVQHGPSTGGVALYGQVLPKLNDWNTYETEITSGTVSNFDGKWNRWVNGAAPYSGTNSMNTARWNFMQPSNPNPLYSMVSFGEITVNSPTTASAWQPNTTYAVGSYVSYGTNSYSGKQVIYVCQKAGTSGATPPTFVYNDINYQFGFGNNYIFDGTTKWQWWSTDPNNQTGLSGVNWYYGPLYVDDSLCRIVLSTESNYNYTGNTSSKRELQIPTAWNSAGDSITFSYRQGELLSGTVAYLYIIDANGTATQIGTVTV